MSAVSNLPSKLSMIILGVEDLPRSIAFYRDSVGLELHSQTPEMAFFATGGVSLVLSAPLGRAVKPLPGATEIVFPVESVTASHSLLCLRDCRFNQEPREVFAGSWAATFTDPDGHRLTLFGAK